MRLLRHPAGSIVQEDIQQILSQCEQELERLGGQTLMITGASGFVGSYLVEAVLSWNDRHPDHSCRLLLPTRDVARVRQKRPHFFRDETYWFSWNGQALAGLPHANFIIHAAAPADPAIYMSRPLDAMLATSGMLQSVLSYAMESAVQSFLFISSGAVYGQPQPGMTCISESYTGGPSLADTRSCYGETKRYCEMLCRLSGLPVRIARLFAFTGPYQDLQSSFAVPDFIWQAWKTGTIQLKGAGSALRTYCYASDLSAGLLKMLLLGHAPDVCNIGGEEVLSILDLAHAVAALHPGTTIQAPVSGQDDTGRNRYVPCLETLHSFYAPTIPVHLGLSRMVQSLVQQKLLPDQSSGRMHDDIGDMNKCSFGDLNT